MISYSPEIAVHLFTVLFLVGWHGEAPSRRSLDAKPELHLDMCRISDSGAVTPQLALARHGARRGDVMSPGTTEIG